MVGRQTMLPTRQFFDEEANSCGTLVKENDRGKLMIKESKSSGVWERTTKGLQRWVIPVGSKKGWGSEEWKAPIFAMKEWGAVAEERTFAVEVEFAAHLRSERVEYASEEVGDKMFVIVAAQGKALSQEDVREEKLYNLVQQMEKKEDGSLYFMDRVWVPLMGGVRTVIMDEAHKSRDEEGSFAGETTDKVVVIKEKLQAARNRQKSYADSGRKMVEFNVGDRVLLKVSPWKGVYCVRERRKTVTIVDKTLRFVEEPVEIMDREIKRVKRSRIPIVKVRWDSKRGPEYTWEREDHMKSKYTILFCVSDEDNI
ncbi:hypothetical protein Tco_1393452 [Tanacetum coccineum]